MSRISSRSRRVSLVLVLTAGLVGGLAPSLVSAQDTASDNDMARRAIHVCASCHGEGGRSQKAEFPHLAGQSAQYLSAQLKDFRAQQRSEGGTKAYMWGVSALLDDKAIESLSEYYAAQTPAPGRTSASPQVLKLGRAIFEKGIPARNVRACASCHGEQAEGAATFPRLAGQHAAYLQQQLQTFGTRLRPHGVLMKAEVAGMKPAEIKAVAAYLQSM